MDLLTFLSEIIKAVAWPVTILVILLIFRKPLLGLIPALQKFRYHELELDFDVQMRELAVKARAELPQPPKLSETLNRTREHLHQLAKVSPRAAVLEGWLLVEEAAMEAGHRHELKLKSREFKSPLLLGLSLEQAGILDEEKLEIYHRLRNLRNAAAHASDFSFEPEIAMEYADLATQLAEYIRSV